MFSSPLRRRIVTVGVRIIPTQITHPRRITMTDCLPVRFTYALITDSPVIVPMIMKIERKPANCQFKLPKIMNWILETKVLNITRYSDVADDTIGHTPMLRRRGLKMMLPPTPTAIAIVDPTNEIKESLITLPIFILMSPSSYS